MAEAALSAKGVIGAVSVVAGIAAVASTAQHALSPSATTTTATLASPSISNPAFLNRASFGATDGSVVELAASGINAWLAQQAHAAPTASGAPGYWAATPDFHLNWIIRRKADFDAAYQAALTASGSNAAAKAKVRRQKLDKAQFQESFWARAIQGDDQLRHRLALALSEIFVVSFASSTITPRIAASWYDMLSKNAFGNFQGLLKAVTLHPAMGIYLNILGNQQADNDPSRHPDENYAREILQLMSIGLVQLNADGSPKLDTTGASIPTYTHADIAGLANVFTGWGWYATKPSASTFSRQPGDGADLAAADVQPLIAYPGYHSQLQKTFLGASVPAYVGAQPTTVAGAVAVAVYQTHSLDTAMGVISRHPNVAPFIARRLIQRFVTSNPSSAYVGRVAAAFTGPATHPENYGNLYTTIVAVLTDSEALSTASAVKNTFGRLREPVLRMAHWLRACEATSKATPTAPGGNFTPFTDFGDPTQLDQAPLEALSVFNFWTPDYVPPDTNIAKAGLVAPEFQAVDVLTVASYVNLMTSVIQGGGWPGGDVTVSYVKEIAALSNASATAGDAALVDRLNVLLFGGSMSPVLTARLTRVLASTPLPAKSPTAAQIRAVQISKIKNALMIALTSPEYLVQR